MAIELLPEIIGTAVGAGVGLPFEYHAQRLAAREHKPINTKLEATRRLLPDSLEPTTAQRIGRTLNLRLVSLVAGFTTLSGTLTGIAIDQANVGHAGGAKVEWVVDHSGGTTVQVGNNAPALSEINHIVTGVGDKSGINSEAIVAGHNSIATMVLSKVAKDGAQGKADIPTATSLAQSRINSRNSAVFIVTNGNAAGVPSDVLNHAHTGNGIAPVYVVNVEGESQPATTAQLKQIAQETGGKYWNTKQANIAEVSASLKKTLSGYEKPQADSGLEIFASIMAAFSLAAAGVAYKRRRHMPTNRGIK